MSVDNNSYNKGGLIAFLFSFGFSIVFILVISFVYPGIELDEIQEQGAVAKQAEEAEAEAEFDASSVAEPWISTEEMIEHGKTQAQVSCAVCHGVEGKGDGPGSAGVARNFIKGDWKQGGKTIEIYKSVAGGIPGTSMAAFGHMPVADRWAIVHWIRSITENKPTDDADELSKFGASAE